MQRLAIEGAVALPRWHRTLVVLLIFGAAGIGHLFAYTDHHSRRSVETITPLSQAIGVPIDTSTYSPSNSL